jgi:predicted ATPase/DNA-binding SARP family transcriptional activator
MRFGVLGPLAVWTDRGEPVTIRGRMVRALLADLLVHEGRVVSVDRLVEDLWAGRPPADPAAALHVRVSQLRRALAMAEPGGRDLVVSQPPGYALRAPDGAVDAARFAALTGQAQAANDPRARAALLTEALALWRGAALADFADEEFARAAVARWEEQRLAALEACAEARLELGEHAELVGELGELVAAHPFRERLRAAHMRALHRSGRTSEALNSFMDLRRALAGELGLEPGPELAALQQAILTGDPAEDPPAPRPARPATNLPASVTELVGRDIEVREVREALITDRLVTLTGPGGVGKTSVAITAARALTSTWAGGAWLVDLTAWDGRGDAAEPVLAALSIPDAPGPARERLADALRDRRMLLVLDNCEHVIERVAELVGALLPVAPELRVLATSREPLRLRGERRIDLPPLEVPGTDDPERLAECPAVRLFLARSGLPAGPGTVAAVAEVCRRLDGIPLALELAATRAAALGVPELAARLRVPTDRFGLLATGPRDAPARQRTLAAVIDWSWRLLTDAEQTVLRRLAVHSGGCTLAAAEAVCADGRLPGDGQTSGGIRPQVAREDVLDLVAGLVDRSLVRREDGGRFRLLESVAAYCLEQLSRSGEEDVVRRRHAAYYLRLAEEAAPHLRGPGQREWLHRLDAEAANMRAALETYRREGEAEQALRLATALTWHWFLRGRLAEALRALTTALAVPGEAPKTLRATAEAWQAGLAIRLGQAGPERAAEALNRYPEEDRPGWARAAWFLAASTVDFGDEKATADLLERALEVFRAEGDRWGEAAALSTRAMLAHMRGDTAALEDDARRGAALFGELGDGWGVLQARDWLVGLADLTGGWAEAALLAEDNLRLAEDLGLWPDVAGQLSWLAWLAVQTGDHERALGLAEQAKQLAGELGQRSGAVFADIALAFAARRAGRLDLAEEGLRGLLSEARRQQTGDASPPYMPMVLVELGMLATRRGDAAAALSWHRQGFDIYREQGLTYGMAWALAGMAEALVVAGRTDVAARLLGAAASAWRDSPQPLSGSERAELARIRRTVEAAEPDFATLYEAGGALSPDQARHPTDPGRLDHD